MIDIYLTDRDTAKETHTKRETYTERARYRHTDQKNPGVGARRAQTVESPRNIYTGSYLEYM